MWAATGAVATVEAATMAVAATLAVVAWKAMEVEQEGASWP